MKQMRRHEEKFKEYMRMNMPVFNTLLELIPEDIEKSATNIWRPILVLIKDSTSILQELMHPNKKFRSSHTIASIDLSQCVHVLY